MRPVIALCATCIALLFFSGTASAASPDDRVPLNHWAYAAMRYLCETGVLLGLGESFFDPASQRFAGGRGGLSREDFASLTVRLEGIVLEDKQPSHYYAMVNDLRAEFNREVIAVVLRDKAMDPFIADLHVPAPACHFLGRGAPVPLFDTAYSSIIKLQQQGLLAGYPDDFFILTEPRTVYDFAQAIIVAQSNAVRTGNLAVQPQLDWLQQRFADQLRPIGWWFGGDLAVE